MSQAKVDRRKELKNNRKEIVAKEKRNKAFTKIVGYLVAAVIVVGLGFSIYSKVNPAPEYDASGFYSLINTDHFGLLDPSIAE